MSGGRLRPLSRLALAGTGVLAAAAAVIGAQALRFAGASLPFLGPAAWLPMVVLAAATASVARATARTLSARPDALDPTSAVARLRWAQASAWTAAVLGGGYLGLALVAAGDAAAPGELWRAVHGAGAGAAGAGWLAAALWLERLCAAEPPTGGDSAQQGVR